jgi:hypothetical protein
MTATAAEMAWNVRDHVPQDKIAIPSHRGAGALAPVITLDAIRTYHGEAQ